MLSTHLVTSDTTHGARNLEFLINSCRSLAANLLPFSPKSTEEKSMAAVGIGRLGRPVQSCMGCWGACIPLSAGKSTSIRPSSPPREIASSFHLKQPAELKPALCSRTVCGSKACKPVRALARRQHRTNLQHRQTKKQDLFHFFFFFFSQKFSDIKQS